jgi:hypothetical protein
MQLGIPHRLPDSRRQPSDGRLYRLEHHCDTAFPILSRATSLALDLSEPYGSSCRAMQRACGGKWLPCGIAAPCCRQAVVRADIEM